jgi:hypothetical protein
MEVKMPGRKLEVRRRKQEVDRVDRVNKVDNGRKRKSPEETGPGDAVSFGLY